MKIIQALKIVFGKDSEVNFTYIFLFLFFAIAFIFFFIELQILLTPEPDNLSLYLKIWRIKDWLIVGFLSILISLNLVFFIYSLYPDKKPDMLPGYKPDTSNNLPGFGPDTIPGYKPDTSGKNPGKSSGKNPGRISDNSSVSYPGELLSNKSCKHPGSLSGRNPGNSSDNHPGGLSGKYPGNKSRYHPGKNIFIGILGTLSGIFSAILATAFCSSCLAVLFSILGISFSTGIFFLKYKFLIFLLSTILLLISLYFQSKRIINKCQC